MTRTLPLLLSLVAVATLAACQTSLTEASVTNAFPEGASRPTLTKVWFRSTLYTDPIGPGETSELLRVGTGVEPAWGILALSDGPGADAPPRITVVRTRAVIVMEPGDERHIDFSPAAAFVGCGGPDGLSREDYEIARTRIFPGDGLAPFDEATGCVAAPGEGAADAGTD